MCTFVPQRKVCVDCRRRACVQPIVRIVAPEAGREIVTDVLQVVVLV